MTLGKLDLGDEAHTLVDTLSFEVAPGSDFALGRPVTWLAVEDLKELVRLAEEQPEALGRGTLGDGRGSSEPWTVSVYGPI